MKDLGNAGLIVLMFPPDVDFGYNQKVIFA